MLNLNSKYIPILFLILLDFLAVLLSVYLSASLIVTNFIPYLSLFLYFSCLFFFIVFFVYLYLGSYTYLNRTFALHNIKSLIYGSILVFIIIYILKNILEFNNINLYFWDNYFLSIKNIFNQTVLFCLLSIIFRLAARQISIIILIDKKKNDEQYKNYILYGAGSSGLALLESIKNNNFLKPYFIIDDDPSKIGRYIHGVKIISFAELEDIIEKDSFKIDKVIFCIPSLGSFKTDKIKKKFDKLKIKFINNIEKISKKEISKILTEISKKSQKINEDLNDEIRSYYDDKVVLITGGGGSIGKEICYKISRFKIKKLIVVDIDEYRLSVVNREVTNNNKKLNKKYFNYLIDINEFDRIFEIFKEHKPDIVYHAAASKHVDLVEKNWFFASLNNIRSTYNICECSKINKVKKTIFISTDKAVEPINFLGLSKAVGEKIIKFYGEISRGLHFSTVRFGNVVGSSGSLLDSLKHQLNMSNIVNITDKRMTRYFMTISDAANLVIISTKISKNGDCHVLKMGKPVKILDIINSIIEERNSQIISKKKKIKIKVIGKRPGEKLHEKLYNENIVEKTDNEYILNEKATFKNTKIVLKNFLHDIQLLHSDKKKFKKKLNIFLKI